MARINYHEIEEGAKAGSAKPEVFADNGESVLKLERYDSKSNAERGLADAARTILRLVADGEIDLTRAT